MELQVPIAPSTTGTLLGPKPTPSCHCHTTAVSKLGVIHFVQFNLISHCCADQMRRKVCPILSLSLSLCLRMSVNLSLSVCQSAVGNPVRLPNLLSVMVRFFARPSVHSFLTTPLPKSGDVLVALLIFPYVMLSRWVGYSSADPLVKLYQKNQLVEQCSFFGSILPLPTICHLYLSITVFITSMHKQKTWFRLPFYLPVYNPPVILRVIRTQSYTNAKSTINCHADIHSLIHPISHRHTHT